MEVQRGIRGKIVPRTYSYAPEQIKAVLDGIGVEVVSETHKVFASYCPFHSNRDTYAFAVNKDSGAFICFNPSCGRSGSFVQLVQALSDRNEQEALRFIEKKGGEVQFNISTFLDDMMKTDELPLFPQMKVEELHNNLLNSPRAIEYMEGRGFTLDTLKHFEVGYSEERDMIVVPAHDHKDKPVGIIGRSVEGKQFKNSKGFPRNQIVYNLNRAKRVGDTAIITESSFDTMLLHQAGYPNGVALLGGVASKEQFSLLERHFTRIIIMTDADKAGRELGKTLAAGLRSTLVQWAVYKMGEVYPDGAKDVGDMTEEQIKKCIQNSISDFEYWAYKGLR